MPAEAVIFDMDGVLSDTQMIHAQLESDLLRRFGIEMSPEDLTREFAGVPDPEMFQAIFQRHGKDPAGLEKLLEGKWDELKEKVRGGGVPPVPGSRELVRMLRGRGVRLAVASSSYRSFVELVLQELDLAAQFQAVVTVEDVERGKPHPDIFLLAAERLGVPPPACVVIEDGINGMMAAKRAGMKCIALVPLDSREEHPADLVVSTLKDIPPSFFDA
jgi:HAD superfamily hydrolase (TIGR01509 family)